MPLVPLLFASLLAVSGPSPLAPLSFLVGNWEAAGKGKPGHSIGRFSFEWAADQHALIRRNESAAAATGKHTDIMIVYLEADSVRALYTDSEGHTFAYAVRATPERVVFESSGPETRYRLWYERAGSDSLTTGFEIAPPGAPGFKPYLEGAAHRLAP